MFIHVRIFCIYDSHSHFPYAIAYSCTVFFHSNVILLDGENVLMMVLSDRVAGGRDSSGLYELFFAGYVRFKLFAECSTRKIRILDVRHRCEINPVDATLFSSHRSYKVRRSNFPAFLFVLSIIVNNVDAYLLRFPTFRLNDVKHSQIWLIVKLLILSMGV